jgi:ElaB/YqjD/DUF883 family membrane-anchored ribosome-binding protein
MTSKLFTASLLATALLAGLGMSPAMAQGTNTPGIDNTQQAISERIQQGMQSGRITPSEAQALYARDREISVREMRVKSDGNATQQERQELRNDLAALSGDVERMIANNVVVAPPGGYGGPGGPGNTNGIDNQEYNIGQRIDEGVRSGYINQHEERKLRSRQRTYERHEASFKSDGVVTKQERRQLRTELSALRDQVERMMRNDRRGRG